MGRMQLTYSVFVNVWKESIAIFIKFLLKSKMAVKVPLMQSMKLCVFHEAILDERYEIQPTTNKTNVLL